MNEHWENDMQQVPTIDLGHGLEVSRIGFGGMALSHIYGQTDPADALAAERSEERRVGKECRSRWSPYH